MIVDYSILNNPQNRINFCEEILNIIFKIEQT